MLGFKVYIILGVIAVALLGTYSWHIYDQGREAAKAEQVRAQAKNTKKVKKVYAKIDKETPFDGERVIQLEWLQQRATRQ